MANIKTKIDEWEVKDLEDNSVIRIYVEHNTEMGNNGVPGIQIWSGGNILNFEPLHVERWAYAARKAGQTEYLLEDASWMYYPDTYIKYYLVAGDPLQAKVEVKVRSSDKPVTKSYDLPFAL
jgi:hypothetical protein